MPTPRSPLFACSLIHSLICLLHPYIQCDNDREFDNTELHSLTAAHDLHILFSCPYTFQQICKVERIIYIQSMTSCVLSYFKALHHATDFLNRLRTKTVRAPLHILLFITRTPTTHLFMFSVVFTAETLPPLCPTNSHHGLALAFFFVIILIIRLSIHGSRYSSCPHLFPCCFW
jgi:hypothetical protein